MIIAGLAAWTTGCVHSTIVPFHPATPRANAVAPERVEIYRGHGPYETFSELGAITVRTRNFDIPWIYQQLRRDAGAFGADAVIDLKIHSEQHTEWETDQHCTTVHECDANNICTARDYCTPVTRTVLVTDYVAVGSMIRRQK